ncbi:MAG: hypothetical protein WCZ66_00650 [Sphingomonadaceae bacterium]
MKWKFVRWMQQRAQEPATWMGMAMIAVVMGSDPVRAHGMAEAISLIVGGGLVAGGTGRRMLMRRRAVDDGALPECESVVERDLRDGGGMR